MSSPTCYPPPGRQRDTQISRMAAACWSSVLARLQRCPAALLNGVEGFATHPVSLYEAPYADEIFQKKEYNAFKISSSPDRRLDDWADDERPNSTTTRRTCDIAGGHAAFQKVQRNQSVSTPCAKPPTADCSNWRGRGARRGWRPQASRAAIVEPRSSGRHDRAVAAVSALPARPRPRPRALQTDAAGEGRVAPNQIPGA